MVYAWERVSVAETDPPDQCVGRPSVEHTLCILIVGGHTTHVRSPRLCVPRVYVYGLRAREPMISENTAARVDQWQHADSTAGQPAIRDDEIRGRETGRRRE